MTDKSLGPFLKFGLKFLSFLEAIIPAFLLAWAQKLRHDLKREQNSHGNTKHELDSLKTQIETEQKYVGKTDRDVVDDFLAGDGHGPNDNDTGG